MGVTALYDADVTLPVGGIWDLGAEVFDADDVPVAFAPPITIVPPSGAPVVLYPTAPDGDGRYSVTYTIALAGRHVATLVSTYGVTSFTAYGEAVTTAEGMPSLADLRGADPDRMDPDDLGYLGGNSFTDAQIQRALDAEAQAQRDVCRVSAVYPDSLREALLRRVKRNLAMAQLPLAVLQGDSESGEATTLPGRDPEVRRLEAPYRKLPIG